MPRPILPLIAVPALIVAASAVPSAHAHDGSDDPERDRNRSHQRVHEYEADLDPLNKDGEGEVELTQRGTRLVVELRAEGLDGGLHVAHIHGHRQAKSECPSLRDDADRNGFVDLVEGVPSFGPIQLTLSDPATDRGTSLQYARTFTQLDSGEPISALGDLDEYAVVLHGVDLNGDGAASNPDVQGDGAADHDDHEITMPALCGQIEAD